MHVRNSIQCKGMKLLLISLLGLFLLFAHEGYLSSYILYVKRLISHCAGRLKVLPSVDHYLFDY